MQNFVECLICNIWSEGRDQRLVHSRWTGLNWDWTDLQQVDPVTRRVIGHASERHKVDWLQFCSVQFDDFQCEHPQSNSRIYGRPHIWANEVSWPPGKIYEKLNSENMQKRAVFYVYVIFWEQSWQAGVENGAMLTTYLFRYTSECTIS